MEIRYKNYVIKSDDSYNNKLVEIKQGEAKKANPEKNIKVGDAITTEVNHGYYPIGNLEGPVNKIIALETARKKGVYELTEAVKEIRKIKEEILKEVKL